VGRHLIAAGIVVALGCPLSEDALQHELVCAELTTEVCGPAGECQESDWCQAVELLTLSDQDGSRCRAALDDPGRYAPCIPAEEARAAEIDFNAPSCQGLLDHVCGAATGPSGDRPCADQEACVNAQLLASPAPSDAGATTSPEELCAAALQEPGLYSRCQP